MNIKMIPVTDPQERGAVLLGEIPGDVYADGEIWADARALLDWRLVHPEAVAFTEETENG